MICPKCNTNIEDNVKFCPKCGCRIDTTLGSSTENLYIFCSNCGKKLLKDSMFCDSCGKQITQLVNSPGSPRFDYSRIPQQPVLKPKKRTGLKVIGIIIILVFAILFIIGRKDNTTEIINQVKNASGTVNIGEAVIKLPNDTQDYDMSIYEKTPEKNTSDEKLAFSSNLYEIEGNLNTFNKKIDVEIALTDEQAELVKKTPGLMNNTYIVFLEEVYTDSYGISFLERRLDSKIDIDNKIITASLDMTQREALDIESKNSVWVCASSNNLDFVNGLFITKSYADSTNQEEKTSIGFQVKSYKCFWEQVLSDDGWFRVVYDTDSIHKENVPVLLEDLQWSKSFIEDLGFSFKTIYKPIYVEIKALDGRIGEYQGSKFLRSNDALYIDEASFNLKVDGYKKLKREEVKITAAHELFHLVQSYYNPQTRVKQNHPWASKPFLWLEEAASTWLEPMVAGENYKPENAANNISFVNSPLAFTQNGDHGYGASIFIKYIEGKTDKEFLSNVFLYAKMNAGLVSSVPDGASISAFNQVMREVYQKNPEELWIDFIKTYYLDSKSIYSWLDTSAMKKKSVLLEAKTIHLDDDKTNEEFTFKTNVSTPTHITDTSKGNYQSKINAKVQINCTLENLSADFMKIGFSGKHQAFNWEGAKLKVSVNTTGKTGVMVYDSKGNSISGSPWNFLSSSVDADPYKGSNTVMIENYKPSGTGDIILMPVNFDASDKKSSGTINIIVEYIPGEKPEEPPEDTPKPSEPTAQQNTIPQGDIVSVIDAALNGTYVDNEGKYKLEISGGVGSFIIYEDGVGAAVIYCQYTIDARDEDYAYVTFELLGDTKKAIGWSFGRTDKINAIPFGEYGKLTRQE